MLVLKAILMKQETDHWIFDDGGRADAGFKAKEAHDCVCRSIAIATELPYQSVYDALNVLAKETHTVQERRRPSQSRTGVHRPIYERFLKDLGWVWTPTMFVGSGCKVHLKADELPSGRIICRLSKHLAAMVDGVIHDTHDPSRGGTRCCYGYFSHPDAPCPHHHADKKSCVHCAPVLDSSS